MLDSSCWTDTPETLALPVDEVHVWQAELNQPPQVTRNCLTLLTPDERARAARFHFDRDRNHFIVARGLLRQLLARYLKMKPANLRFRYGSHGKPSLIHDTGVENLSFNLSHSHERALCAVARGRELGVDIEHLRPEFADRDVAERFFSRLEVAALSSLPEEAQVEGFFNCWTRKEAYVKAVGEGLSLPLDRFDVSLKPGEPAALLGTRGLNEEVSRWQLMELLPGAGYAGALVAEGSGWHLRCWRWAEKDFEGR